ncbi:hypothetical protein P691DRAFT_679525 [Macrolepiota fuliginosa MF-IS2]|uniref:Uncharacterized protein n=1 Tax=Macrolepiota fuliginosa MF-IS2 TaxID=1400762 RepID=A0A9P5X2J8_9AGAR|nr:hypothetical protein P691DRAFT_679525 [Macrolepiota fuliginosa MF-IS2]
MDHRRISPDLNQRTLSPLDQEMSPRAIAEVLGVPAKSIGCWRVVYEQYDCVAPPGVLLGRPRLLTALILEELCQLIEHDHPTLYLDELRDWLAVYHDIQWVILLPINTSATLCYTCLISPKDMHMTEW